MRAEERVHRQWRTPLKQNHSIEQKHAANAGVKSDIRKYKCRDKALLDEARHEFSEQEQIGMSHEWRTTCTKRTYGTPSEEDR